MEKLQGCDATVIDAGEAVIIQTPTAGGYGKPEPVARLQVSATSSTSGTPAHTRRFHGCRAV